MRASVRRNRSERHIRMAVRVTAVIGIDARAELVDIRWDSAGPVKQDAAADGHGAHGAHGAQCTGRPSS